jgi:myo-inositol catabolism protein IolC
MVGAIEQLQDAGIEPDVWKVEGLDRREDCEKIVVAARRNGRTHVGCTVLGRGEDDQKVREWLATAASVRGSSASPWAVPCSGNRLFGGVTTKFREKERLPK